MKNLSIDHIGGLFLTNTAGVLLAADTHSTTPPASQFSHSSDTSGEGT